MRPRFTIAAAARCIQCGQLKSIHLDFVRTSGSVEGLLDKLTGLRKLSLIGTSLATLKGFPSLPNLRKARSRRRTPHPPHTARAQRQSDRQRPREVVGVPAAGGAEPCQQQDQGAGRAHAAGCLSVCGGIASLPTQKSLASLVSLDLDANPVCDEDGFREKVFALLPGLEVLNEKDQFALLSMPQRPMLAAETATWWMRLPMTRTTRTMRRRRRRATMAMSSTVRCAAASNQRLTLSQTSWTTARARLWLPGRATRRARCAWPQRTAAVIEAQGSEGSEYEDDDDDVGLNYLVDKDLQAGTPRTRLGLMARRTSPTRRAATMRRRQASPRTLTTSPPTRRTTARSSKSRSRAMTNRACTRWMDGLHSTTHRMLRGVAELLQHAQCLANLRLEALLRRGVRAAAEAWRDLEDGACGVGSLALQLLNLQCGQ